MRSVAFALATTALMLVSSAQTALGQIRTFPYEAVVESEDLYVRSGPGKKYYPTGKIARGQKVMVHRHDPGGWFMIAPPPGSFSWVPAAHVKPLGNGRGLVVANDVVVRVGSAFGDTQDVEQSRLSMNAEVQILEQKTVETEHGPAPMYKIVPPRDEYRWIEGKFVTPVDPQVRRQNDSDPFAVPTQAKRAVAKPVPAAPASFGSESMEEPAPAASPRPAALGFEETPEPSSEAGFGNAPVSPPAASTKPASTGKAVRRNGPPPEQLQAERERLQELDAQLQAMIQQDMGQWDLAALEGQFVALREQAVHPAIPGQVDVRLASFEKYRKLKAEYDEFMRITQETTRRDLELAALQQHAGAPLVATPVGAMRIVPVSEPETVSDTAAPAAGPMIPMPQPTTLTAPDEPTGVLIETPTTVPSDDGFLPPIVIQQASPPSEEAMPAIMAQPAVADPNAPQVPTVNRIPPGTVAPPTGPVQPGASVTPISNPRGTPAPVPAQAVPPQPAGTGVPSLAPVPDPASAQPKFDGAGIIQRAPTAVPGQPSHVLVAPDGRVLAFLQAGPGISLDRHVGQAMGIYGERGFEPSLKADLIIVRNMAAVRLAP